jgi:uncharacterized protein
VSGLWPQLAPVILLVCSNLFMTIAWYGHLKKVGSARNRGTGELRNRLRGILLRRACQSHRQRCLFAGRAIQEVITLIMFAGFTAVYFKEPLSLTQSAGFALIALGAMLVFRGQPNEKASG